MARMRGEFVGKFDDQWGRYGFGGDGRPYRSDVVYTGGPTFAVYAVRDGDPAGTWMPVTMDEVGQAHVEFSPKYLRAEFEATRQSLQQNLNGLTADLVRDEAVPAVVGVLRLPGVQPVAAARALAYLSDPQIAVAVDAVFRGPANADEAMAARVNLTRVREFADTPQLREVIASYADDARWSEAMFAGIPWPDGTFAPVSWEVDGGERGVSSSTRPIDGRAESSRAALAELADVYGRPFADLGVARAIESVAKAELQRAESSWNERLDAAWALQRATDVPSPWPAVQSCALAAIDATYWATTVTFAGGGTIAQAVRETSTYVAANSAPQVDPPSASGSFAGPSVSGFEVSL